MSPQSKANIQVEITDASEFHCFRLTFNPHLRSGCCDATVEEWNGDAYCGRCKGSLGPAPERVEILLHAAALVDLIHKSSLALCEWQAENSKRLILQMTGLSEEVARQKGLIA